MRVNVDNFVRAETAFQFDRCVVAGKARLERHERFDPLASDVAISSSNSTAPGMSVGSSSTMMLRNVGSWSRTGAIFLRYKAAVVTIATPSPIATRCRMGSGRNALNNGANTLRALSVPSTAAYNSGTHPTRLNTRSPGPIPNGRRALAKRLVRRASSAYVTSCCPCLVRQRRATWSPRPCATCRSTASYAMFNPSSGSPSSQPRASLQLNGAPYSGRLGSTRRSAGSLRMTGSSENPPRSPVYTWQMSQAAVSDHLNGATFSP